MIGGKRVWFSAGESHYFRHTADTWEDVLWRIKQAGLNTVSTYMAWNLHEPAEGQFDFAGDCDLGHFLDLANDMGLYVFARPGPYICSEWTGGGFPAWLQAKSGVYLRENNPVYMDAVRAYWDQLIPIVAERQIDRGGSVVLVQAENEYRPIYCDERRDYIAELVQWLRDYDITVPVTGCNAHSHDGKTVVTFYAKDGIRKVGIDDLVLTYNTGLDAVPLEDLKAKQPNAPLFTTEQWCGGLMSWGQKPDDWPARNRHAAAVTGMLGCGSMVNYYMFEGGTNFGYNGGMFATSYRSAYPVGEGGELQEKYWATKPLNHLQQCLGDWFAVSESNPETGWKAPEGALLRERRTDRGALLFLGWDSNDNQKCELLHDDGGSIELSFGASPHAILPLGFEAFDGEIIEQSNVSLLWVDAAAKTIFVYGAAGAFVSMQLSSGEIASDVKRHQPLALKTSTGTTVIVLDEFLAGRFWLTENGSYVIGAYFIHRDGTVVNDRDGHVWEFSEGTLGSYSGDLERLRGPRSATLPEWKTWSASGADAALEWRSIDAPQIHEHLGLYAGGSWYRASLDVAEAGWSRLLIPSFGNGIVNVYHNGEFIGSVGEIRTRDMSLWVRENWREQIALNLTEGKNEFLFYSEDMGRPVGGTPAPIGIAGDVCAGARSAELENLTDVSDAPVSEEAFWYLRFQDFPEIAHCQAIDFDVTAEAGESIQICFRLALLDLFADCFEVNTFAVEVNGQILDPVGIPSCEMNAFQVPVPDGGGAVRVRVLYNGSQDVLLNLMEVWAYTESSILKDWQWSPFVVPESAPAAAGDLKVAEAAESRLLFPVSLDDKVEQRGCRPTWYSTTFEHPGDGKHFLKVGKLFRGQIFINGQHAGRYWQKQPIAQDRYYLPSAWMQEENTLTIFEETGCLPVNVALVTQDEI